MKKHICIALHRLYTLKPELTHIRFHKQLLVVFISCYRYRHKAQFSNSICAEKSAAYGTAEHKNSLFIPKIL